jgi:tripartite-type tricarboxylate transporter receptor subunit TctC
MFDMRRMVVFAVLALAMGSACAQSYPSRPIRWIIDFPAGGASDTLARVVGEKLTQALGQQVVYDNRPGANGIIAYSIAARAPADGYTLVVLSTPFPLNAALGRKLAYDTLKDFTPIARIADYPNLLVVHPSVPVRSVKDFIAHAKSKAGAMTYASSGTGSVQHLAMEQLRRLAGFEAVHVPYAGSAPAVANLAGGHVESLITILITATPHLRAGRVRAIGILSAERSIHLPDVPTLAEAGVPLVAPGWGGMGAPAGLPKQLVNRLSSELARIVKLPEVRERIAAVGAEPHHSGPQEFATFIRSEVERWRPIIQEAGVKVD